MLAKSQIWQNDVTLEFIEYYKTEPMLWDPKHPDYKNKSELNNAWERIKTKMSIIVSVQDLKRKKESLMTAYRLHNRKRREESKTNIFWFAFDSMDAFLGPIYNPGDNNSSSDVDEIVEEPEYRSRSIKKERLSTSNYKTSTSRKRPSEVSYSYIVPERESDDFDECELYTRLLAKKMRKLDERQRDIVMHEIDNILFRAKMNSEGVYKKITKIKSPEPPVFIVSDVNEYDAEYLEADE